MTNSQQKRLAENRKLRTNKNVLAALEMISKSEGTNGDYKKMVYGVVVSSAKYPSLIGKKNVSIPSLASFPGILVKVNNAGLKSSAAGKYQILSKTYKGAAAAMGLNDFSPETQDLIAIELLRQRKAINYIVNGDIESALTKTTLNKEWASFAGAGYGQGENSLKKLIGWFRSGVEFVKENPVEAGGGSAVVVAVAVAISVFFYLVTIKLNG